MPDASPANPESARQQRGNEAVVRAAFLTVGSLSEIDLDAPVTTDEPTKVVLGVFERLLTCWKVVYPDHELMQSASLSLEKDDDKPGYLLIDSEVFFDSYIRVPVYAPLSGEVPSFQAYLDNIIGRAYSCGSQVSAAATDDLTLDDMPGSAAFEELVRFFALDRLPTLVPALEWVLFSDVHFGVTSDGEFPGLAHIVELESCLSSLTLQLKDAAGGADRPSVLKRLLVDELALLVSVLRVSRVVFDDVERAQETRHEESALADGFNAALLPITRIVAAEHLSYIRNRKARAAATAEGALAHYRVACQLAHFAFNTARSARYAKYVAQNLLEISDLRGDPSRRSLSETIWIDAYVMPFVFGLTASKSKNRPFSELGWTSPTLPLPTGLFDYVDIPPYSDEPTFLYSGVAAEVLKRIIPSFTPDLWAAAVLLVQHFKDLGDPYGSLLPDRELALFVPSESSKGRFPMRNHHPVAWLYYLAEALLVEHQSMRHLHAGLYFAPLVDHSYRTWIDARLREAFASQNSSDLRSPCRPRFPNTATYLGLVVEQQGTMEAEDGGEPSIWADVASRWAG